MAGSIPRRNSTILIEKSSSAAADGRWRRHRQQQDEHNELPTIPSSSRRIVIDIADYDGVETMAGLGGGGGGIGRFARKKQQQLSQQDAPAEGSITTTTDTDTAAANDAEFDTATTLANMTKIGSSSATTAAAAIAAGNNTDNLTSDITEDHHPRPETPFNSFLPTDYHPANGQQQQLSLSSPATPGNGMGFAAIDQMFEYAGNDNDANTNIHANYDNNDDDDDDHGHDITNIMEGMFIDATSSTAGNDNDNTAELNFGQLDCDDDDNYQAFNSFEDQVNGNGKSLIYTLSMMGLFDSIFVILSWQLLMNIL